jgi:uncharacterized membrane protein (UPF0136 family)
MMYISSALMAFYGLFLILCGIIAVIFIGRKAKTALISGGSSGALSLLIASFMSQMQSWALIGGLILTLALSVVFAWRATKTLFSVFDMLKNQSQDLKGKGIAFLIISLMCVISVFTFAQLCVYFAYINSFMYIKLN